MGNLVALRNRIQHAATRRAIAQIYPHAQSEQQIQRWMQLVERGKDFLKSDGPYYLFRSPGRSELSGNHTDHNHGMVLVATLEADIIACVTRRADTWIKRYNCDDGQQFAIDGNDLKVKQAEVGTSNALVRGVAAAMSDANIPVQGCNIVSSAQLPAGKGLSSSAAFELLIATILNRLSGAPSLSAIELAKAGQYAENRFFGKPCGLEDQIGSASGGVTWIDFENSHAIRLQQIAVDFAADNIQLGVVDCNASHSELTPHYAQIPAEMKMVAQHFGHTVLRALSVERIQDEIVALRDAYGDRAVLRSMHFFRENQRVQQQVATLQDRNIAAFLALVRQSGRSSWMLLQNCTIPQASMQQEMALVLNMTEDYMRAHNVAQRAACRVHGGGFAGAIQVYLPNAEIDEYIPYIENIIGKAAWYPLHISPIGATELVVE